MLSVNLTIMKLIGLIMLNIALGYAAGAASICGMYGKPNPFKLSLFILLFVMCFALHNIWSNSILIAEVIK